jgi:hypothetical protein
MAGACFGCQNNTQRGAAVGGIGGAALGAIVGKATGNTAAGAAIGGLGGAAAGALVGNSEDVAEQRDANARQAAYEHNLRVRQERAVTNRDVIDMARDGVSDAIICNAIRTRGGNFNTSPQSIVYLQRSGVSDTVIQAMQNTGGY